MALFVKFYSRPVFNAFQSDKESRPIHDMKDFVRIEIPGIVANVVDTFADDTHKREHPIEWARYLQEKETGITAEHVGTLLANWPQLNAAQALELKHYKFYTVEGIAEASDAQVEAIGMAAGMAPRSLRDKAKAWLANAKGKADDSVLAGELAKRDSEIAELRAMVEKLASQPNKGGRPKKETASA